MKIESDVALPNIKYPQRNETVVSPLYAVCVATPAAVRTLEISIDQGPWRACRKEIGYWWHDWSDYANGDHEIIARTRGQSGRWRLSALRKFRVDVLMRGCGLPRSLPSFRFAPSVAG